MTAAASSSHTHILRLQMQQLDVAMVPDSQLLLLLCPMPTSQSVMIMTPCCVGCYCVSGWFWETSDPTYNLATCLRLLCNRLGVCLWFIGCLPVWSLCHWFMTVSPAIDTVSPARHFCRDFFCIQSLRVFYVTWLNGIYEEIDGDSMKGETTIDWQLRGQQLFKEHLSIVL